MPCTDPGAHEESSRLQDEKINTLTHNFLGRTRSLGRHHSQPDNGDTL